MRELERAIVLLLLSDECQPPCSRVQLAAQLDAEAQPLEEALGRLAAVGAVHIDGDAVSAALAVRHIDELGLIGI